MSTSKRTTRDEDLGPARNQEGLVGKDSMGRRVWDKDYFKSKYEASLLAEPPKKIMKGPSENLKTRSGDLGLESKLSGRLVIDTTSSMPQQGGFFCEVCDCLLRDSRAYLDHINGRSHNRMLGMTMNVAKVTVERVIAKMERIRSGLE
jgi:U4/U6.U5 tri-snRNP component SNU23